MKHLKLTKDQECYQRMAERLGHVCRNLISDHDQPPTSHRTMMRHILRTLSSDPGNIDVVYRHMLEEEFQNKWLCVKAMCDDDWEGDVWSVDNSCGYCKGGNKAEDPITLCYQIKPREGKMALYREIGIIRVSK
ncbi:hypothetical protein B0T19DRAFT_437397 [Cercophora scortea]|uniref:Uncharacterized protein n=1 Tax=Cercophora scortea TaxID=314031 RepID=A0AAE0J4C9_9PEZI|nr:hypothetical protein B0T19DRAFT_437397 [Cercophora scortea]